jgi:hypothetical protein
VTVIDEDAGLSRVQGGRSGRWRLRPRLLPRLFEYLEDPTDGEGWTLLLEKDKLVIVRASAAIDHWKQWRKGR